METLISDSNRSVATLAITTLLKTGENLLALHKTTFGRKMLVLIRFLAHAHPSQGAESNVDRLMKQISSFMGDIADDFKIVVVDAIRSLCLRYFWIHL